MCVLSHCCQAAPHFKFEPSPRMMGGVPWKNQTGGSFGKPCISMYIIHTNTVYHTYVYHESLQNQASTSRVSSKVSKFWKRSRNWRWKKVKVKKRHTWQVILSSSTWWLIWFWWNLMKNSVHISSLNYTVHWPNELASPRFNAGPKIGTQRVQGIIPPVISSVAC